MKNPQTTCLCNTCEYGPDEDVPFKVPPFFESWCAIGAQEDDGCRISGMVFPKFAHIGSGKVCPILEAFQQRKQKKAMENITISSAV
mgnify:CR=1 FL=1